MIVQEIGAAQDTPDDKVYDLFTEAAFPGQPIGRSILGTPETVEATRPEMLDEYLGRHYRGPGMVLAAAGAVDHDLLVKLATDKLGELSPLAGPKPPKATYRGGDLRETRDHLQETQVMVGFEGRPYTSDTYYTAQLLAAVIGGGMSSRLFQEVAREARALLFDLCVPLGLFGYRDVRRARCDRAGRRRRTDAGDARRTRAGGA